MTDGIRNKADLLLTLLYTGEGSSGDIQLSTSVSGITRLEKLLFILKVDERFLTGVSEKNDFKFVPFRMGPWSHEVYDEVDFLESLGLLTKKGGEKRSAADAAHNTKLFSEMIVDKYEKNSSPLDEQVEIFTLTDKGKNKALEIWKRLSNNERQRLILIKRQFNNMNLKQFLRYVYKKHPEYATNSEILDDLL